METYSYEQYQESAAALRARLGGFTPRVLLILGSGLGALGDEVEHPIPVSYDEVPHMKRSTAPDHKGRFVFGRLAGQDDIKGPILLLASDASAYLTGLSIPVDGGYTCI